MPEPATRFLIIDYNLSRVGDVQRMAEYARSAYGAEVTLVRPNPTATDHRICDEVIDLDPLRPDFVEAGEKLLADRSHEFAAGVVFSDNAVAGGAELLKRLGLAVDSPALADGAFCKHAYRSAEARSRDLLTAQRVLVPDFARIRSRAGLDDFAARHPEGFVVKPTKEGNNRGVVLVGPGDDVDAAFAEVLPYLEDGVICETVIPYRREYSYDGLGGLSFLTEKVSAAGRYPVEVAQILPARLDRAERGTLQRAGRLANLLVGQCDGPFHNEIKLSDDGQYAAVVEPNRRPAGMRIWSLAEWVYGVDLYRLWVDAAFGRSGEVELPTPGCSAAAVMLGVAADRTFGPDDVAPGATPFEDAVDRAAAHHGLAPGELSATEFAWLSPERRPIHVVPRDNADFAAMGCVVLRTDRVSVREVVDTLRAAWPTALMRSCRPVAAPAHATSHQDRRTELEVTR
ncbi:biotin carboxylase [Streptomyces sp. NPDC006385]|uniref:ATP-grasp domain-containing protein n=1 Tax=Streptomyces sp. NPDC006385 TaxID=3156761 RepID=UPI0033B76580